MKNMKYIENSVQNIKKHAKCVLQKGKLLMKKRRKDKNSCIFTIVQQY